MRTSIIKKNVVPSVLPTQASTSTPVAVSDLQTPAVPATTLAAATAAVLGAPSTVVVPSPPLGFSSVTLKDYRGFHPKAGQLAAAPDVVNELRAFPTFAALFGGTVAPANQLADEISVGLSWTTFRTAVEALLLYAKSGEAVAWKTALTNLDRLDTVVELVSSTNAAALVGCPALLRMLEVPKVIATRGNVKRARTLANKAKTAAAAPAAAPAGTAVAPATSGTGGTGTGGAAH